MLLLLYFREILSQQSLIFETNRTSDHQVYNRESHTKVASVSDHLGMASSANNNPKANPGMGTSTTSSAKNNSKGDRGMASLAINEDTIPQAPPCSPETRWHTNFNQLLRYDTSWEAPFPLISPGTADNMESYLSLQGDDLSKDLEGYRRRIDGVNEYLTERDASMVNQVNMNIGFLYFYREKHTKLWANSKAARQISGITKEIFTRQSELDESRQFKISSCICLGLGSLFGLANIGHMNGNAPNVITHGINNRNMGQLVAFEKYVSVLRQHFDIPHVYFQDPRFNSLDRAFLTSLGDGFQVIDSPASNGVLTEESFLYAPNASSDAVYASLKTCFPAIYIGKRLYNHRLRVTDLQTEFLKANLWIRRLESAFLKSKEHENLFRLSAWEEDYDHYTRGSICWPRTETFAEKRKRKGEELQERRLQEKQREKEFKENEPKDRRSKKAMRFKL